MEQLKMTWQNDGVKKQFPKLLDNMELVTFPQVENAEKEWTDIVSYGSLLPDERVDGVSYYNECMKGLPTYTDDMCYILKVNGVCAATVSVVCNYETKVGLMHMVGCKPEFRGLGIGGILSQLTEYVFKKEGMQTATLKTDDWRIPAIKTYLKIGYKPDLVSEPDYKERWDKIYQIINDKKIVENKQ